MGLVTRQFGPNAKGSKLTTLEMDNNLYYLQRLGVSGLTYSANTLTVTNPTGGTISVNIASDTNTFITAATYNDLTNTITITDNDDTDFNIYIDAVSGLTVNGVLSATTYLNLPISTDVFVTGGTYSNGDATFTNNIGGTFNVTGFTTGNTLQQVLVNGNTTNGNDIIMSESDNIIFKYAGFNNNINTEPLSSNRNILFPNNNGTVALLSVIQTFTGGTVTGSTTFTNGLSSTTISATTYLNVPSFVNLTLGHSSLNPSDSTTYYIGGLQSLSPSTTNRDSWSIVTQYSGNITEVSILSSFIGGSSEDSTVSIQNLSANTSQIVTSILKYVTGTPVQILFQPFSAATQPSGWTSFLVAFSTYAGLTGTTSTLTSPLFDGSPYNTINVVTEVAKFGAGTDGPILVEYSLNSGATWVSAGTTATPTGSTPYVTSTVVVPTTSSQMLIRFSVNPSGTSGKRLRNVFFNGVTSSLNSNYILSSPLPISSGDKLQIRWTTPIWSTNPTNVTNLYNLKIRL
jgi:hypothetical protein